MSSTAATPTTLDPVIPLHPIRRFSLTEYHQLIDVGVLRPGDPYELLQGVIAYKMPQNSLHASTASKLEMRFWRLLPEEWFLRTQKPVSFPASESEPEPDLAIVDGTPDRYDSQHPGASDVHLLIEVADTSLAVDQGMKLQIYAGAKVPEYWIVNLVDRRVEVYTQSRGGKNPGYRHRVEYGPEDAVPVVVAGKELGSIPVKEVLP